MAEFRMPSLGADMEAGTLVEWLKHPGDAVHRGDIVAVVETQKGAIEVEVFETGVVERLLVEPGVKVPVGTPLALISGGTAQATPSEFPSAAIAPAPSRGGRASPAARRLAAGRGIALGGLTGSGPDGAVVRADVERALAAAPAARPTSRGIDFAEMRRAIAAAMARSKREIPHYYLATPIDLSQSLAWLDAANAARPPARRLLLAALLLKAVAQALLDVPELNGFYMKDGFAPATGIHIGTAVAIRGGGLIAPAIHDVDKLSLDELMSRLRDLIARVRAGTLRSSELTDPTITVTNLGERGVETVFGIVYPPQVALVGFGAPAVRPSISDGQLVARQMLTATLAADHRASDGHRGALFLAAIARKLQQPELL